MTASTLPETVRRLCRLDIDMAEDRAVLRRAASLGFDAVLLAVPGLPAERIEAIAAEAAGLPLGVVIDLQIGSYAAGDPLVAAHPQAFVVRRAGGGEAPVDPRRPAPMAGEARARLQDVEAVRPVVADLASTLQGLAAAGVRGARVLQPEVASVEVWRELITTVRRQTPDFLFIAETEAMAREAVLALKPCGFDAFTSSLPYWDGRARWLVEEYDALRSLGRVLAKVGGAGGPLSEPQRLTLAAAFGDGLIVDLHASTEHDEAIARANTVAADLASTGGEMRLLTGEGEAAGALLRANRADVREATSALLVLVNPDPAGEVAAPDPAVLARAGADFQPFARLDGRADAFAPLAASEVRLLAARRALPILAGDGASPPVQAATQAPRLVVEGVSPRVDGGDFPVRRVVGETLRVKADVFADGHEQLAAEVLWRPLDQAEWSRVAMAELGNDRWRADFPLDRLGRYEFLVEGWLNVFAGYRRDLRKKREAGVAQAVDLSEGVALVDAALRAAKPPLRAKLKARLDRLKACGGPEALGEALLDEGLALLMQQADARPFARRSAVQRVDAERLQARFASWYELFPRSQSPEPGRHGRFQDVVARLPHIRAMGFDVLYFPPIHPIGRTNRKGPNNTLDAADQDIGSPYAIGAESGGHDAIHPELGTLDDFRRLLQAAAAEGLEIALDFAVQCSPDHPWLKQHPGWFDWRPDGTIKYAENPPKKYQDIVNVDFYKPDSLPALWTTLRDIVLFWVGEGVKLFRVDNPHTKPLPFWEWMIGEVRAPHPDVVFLAEAFTRPKVMYRLAKIGFSQSYTYFTWRHSKAEFIDYLTELTQTAPKEFYRPHFFVNTPDINPYFLQTSGRAGFMIRAALAATLSGLLGVYSGFELCEFEPLPGKEEYKDSEKFELRARPERQAGDIVAEITRLNRIRKGHPALQTHLGVEFLPSDDDNMLVFAKATESRDDVVVVAINLDPHSAHATRFELPLWRWGLDDHATLEVEDLVWEGRRSWTGKVQDVHLDPSSPFALWSLRVPVKAS